MEYVDAILAFIAGGGAVLIATKIRARKPAQSDRDTGLSRYQQMKGTK